MPGECQQGYQLSSLGAASYAECQTDCQQTTDCNYFTFYEQNSFCKLLYNCTNVDESLCSDCYTGQPDCSDTICSQPGECQGNIVDDEFSVLTEEECQRLCFENVQCLWYTYDYSVEYCLLTSDCVFVDTYTKLYGQKECYDGNNGGNQSNDKL